MNPKRPRRARRTQHAADVLGGVLGKHGIARELRDHRILARWREIVGESLAERTTPDGLERGVLWVRVKNASWLHQLSFVKDELLAKLAAELGDPPLVKELQFHVGPREKVGADDSLAPTIRIRRAPPRKREAPPPATGAKLQAIEQEAGRVNDDELRDIILDVRKRWNI
jgi:hypothetical protein